MMAAVCWGQITSKRYTLPDANYSKLWDGIGRDDQGNIYIGQGRYEWQYDNRNKDCKVFRYNYGTDGFDDLGTVSAASERLDNWVSYTDANYPANPFDAQGKIHTSFYEYKGKVYFGTHATCDEPTFPEDLETYPKFFRGGHLYAYNKSSGQIEDCNGIRKAVMAPGNGLMSVMVDYHHNGFYGVGYPTGKLFYHDLNTMQSTEIWQTPQGLPNRDAGSITRNMIVDNDGRAWFFGGFGLLGYSHTQKDTVIVPLPPGHIGWNGHFAAVAHSVTRDSIYFVDLGRTEIFRLRVKARKLDYIVQTTGDVCALRWDQEKLYYINNGLKSYHVRTGFIQSYSVGGYGIGAVYRGSGDPIDRNGDIWCSTHRDRDLVKIQLNDPCDICKTAVWDYGTPPVSAKTPEPVKDNFALKVGPNPFSTSVTVSVRRTSHVARHEVRLEVFNIAGKMIANIRPRATSDERRETTCTWSPKTSPNGIYIIKVRIGNRTLTKTATLVR
jgi:hypothetical protein